MPDILCSGAWSRPAEEGEPEDPMVFEVRDVAELPMGRFPPTEYHREWIAAYIKIQDLFDWYCQLHDDEDRRLPRRPVSLRFARYSAN